MEVEKEHGPTVCQLTPRPRLHLISILCTSTRGPQPEVESRLGRSRSTFRGGNKLVFSLLTKSDESYLLTELASRLRVRQWGQGGAEPCQNGFVLRHPLPSRTRNKKPIPSAPNLRKGAGRRLSEPIRLQSCKHLPAMANAQQCPVHARVCSDRSWAFSGALNASALADHTPIKNLAIAHEGRLRKACNTASLHIQAQPQELSFKARTSRFECHH